MRRRDVIAAMAAAGLAHDRADLFVANYLVFDPTTTPAPGANPHCYDAN